MVLDKLREQISSLDGVMLRLAAQRLALASQIGEYKKVHGIPIRNLDVEVQAISRAREDAELYHIDPQLAEDLQRLQVKYAVLEQEKVVNTL